MATCASCGASLGFIGALAGRKLCKSCAEEERRARVAAQQQYRATLLQLVSLVSSTAPVAEIENQLPVLAQQAGLSEGERRNLHLGAFRDFLQQALEDDHLTEQEEARMSELAGALGIDEATFEREFADLVPQMVVAHVNDGRLPVLPNVPIILKKDEQAHISVQADLLKEVILREYRGGYSGVSLRIAKGVRYHVGGARGRSVAAVVNAAAQQWAS